MLFEGYFYPLNYSKIPFKAIKKSTQLLLDLQEMDCI